ncbi:IcmF-related protein [Minicystis rosea]|nr:IcmF-related protein [Minicystis rosea]
MSAFTYEIASVIAAVEKRHPGHEEGSYALPWYLVVGNPGSGRSTALHAMSLTWEGNDGPFQTGAPAPLCTYWMPKEAVFIEPEATVLGPARQPGHLTELCKELCVVRPREPIDGIIVLVNIADFIDLDENGLTNWANGIRRYLVEVGLAIGVDVPAYVILTRYDALWGFAEVFQWTPERKKEDPWGFNLPLDTPSQDSLPRIKEQLDGLNARIENFCLSRLCSEDPVELRVRSFQHLAEVRALMERLRTVFETIGMANSFERAPWIRAVAIGSALPGTSGDRMRAGVSRFFNMGLAQAPAASITGRPGGLPLYALMTNVILPERDLVPLRTRWREDKMIQLCVIFAGLLWVITIIAALVFAMAAAPHKKAAPPLPPPATKTAPKR